MNCCFFEFYNDLRLWKTERIKLKEGILSHNCRSHRLYFSEATRIYFARRDLTMRFVTNLNFKSLLDFA